MNQYLYFSYYDERYNCVGFDVAPVTVENPTPEWVQDNVVIVAPVKTSFVIVSLDYSPPARHPMWLEFFETEVKDAQEN